MNIFLESRIWSDSFDYLKWQIDNAKDKQIDLYIACMGGNVNAGFAIANYIEGVNAGGAKTIRTHILSNADSIATVIFLAPEAKDRSIVESSTMFIHEPRFMWLEDVTAEDAEKASEELKVQEDRIADYYVKKVDGMTKQEAQSLMSGEVNLSAKQMLEYGIVTEIKKAFDIAAFRTNLHPNTNINMFNKKQLNNVTLKQGDVEVQAAYRGDLAEKTELERFGEGEALNGEFVTDSHKMTIENNKVTTLEAVAVEEVETNEEVSAAVEAAVAPILDIVEALVTKVEAIGGEKSTHQTPKATVKNEAPKSDDPQREARKESKARQTENYKKRVEANATRVNNLK